MTIGERYTCLLWMSCLSKLDIISFSNREEKICLSILSLQKIIRG